MVEVTRYRRRTVKQLFSGSFQVDLGKCLKKVAEIVSRDSRLRSRDRRNFRLSKIRRSLLDVSQAIWENFVKKSQERSRDSVVEVTRPLADCQTTFFGRFKRFGKILNNKSLRRSRDSD